MAKGIINIHYQLLVIGGSAGSLEVVLHLLPALRSDLDLAIVIIMHRRAGGDSLLIQLLSEKSPWPVKEAEEKEQLVAKTIYIAPADYHLLIEKNKSFSLDFSEKIHFCRPAIDATFETAAEAYGSSLAALLLSGANADGAAGLLAIHAAGGLTIVQDPEEASVPYMTRQAIELFSPGYVATTSSIIEIINGLNR